MWCEDGRDYPWAALSARAFCCRPWEGGTLWPGHQGGATSSQPTCGEAPAHTATWTRRKRLGSVIWNEFKNIIAPDHGVVPGVVGPDDEHHGVGLHLVQAQQRVVLVPRHRAHVNVVRVGFWNVIYLNFSLYVFKGCPTREPEILTLYLVPLGHNLCLWMGDVARADICEALIIPGILLRKKSAGGWAASAETKSGWGE